jgi:hypothetical protein
MFEQHRDAVANRIRVMRNLSSLMAIVAAVLLLCACGSSSGGGASTTNKSSVTGAAARAGGSTTTTGTATAHSTTSGEQAVSALHGGFHTVIPKGYMNEIAAGGGGANGAEYRALGPKVGGSVSNLTVFRVAADGSNVAALVRRALRNLVNRPSFFPKARGISSPQTLSIDGEPALGASYRTVARKTRRYHVLFVIHRTWAYEISDAAASAGYAASLRALDAVIRSWRWQ